MRLSLNHAVRCVRHVRDVRRGAPTGAPTILATAVASFGHADGVSDRGWIVWTMLDLEATDGEVDAATAVEPRQRMPRWRARA
jgi:hypothetical protein